MYLQAEKSVWSFREDGALKALAKMVDFPMERAARSPSWATVRFTVGYWRKANAVHSWFVRNVQEGIDNCKTYWVSREQLRELQADVQTAYKDRDSDVLEPQSGFFFGSTIKDRWYFQDLKYTNLLIDELLGDPRLEGWDFYYHSSW